MGAADNSDNVVQAYSNHASCVLEAVSANEREHSPSKSAKHAATEHSTGIAETDSDAEIGIATSESKSKLAEMHPVKT